MMSAPARSKLESLGLSASCAEVLTHLWDYLDEQITPTSAERLEGAHRHVRAVPAVRGVPGVLPARDVQPQAGAQRAELPARAPRRPTQGAGVRLLGQGEPRAVALSSASSAPTGVDQSDPGWEITSPIVPFTTTTCLDRHAGGERGRHGAVLRQCERDGALRVLDLDPRAVDGEGRAERAPPAADAPGAAPRRRRPRAGPAACAACRGCRRRRCPCRSRVRSPARPRGSDRTSPTHRNGRSGRRAVPCRSGARPPRRRGR